MDLELARPPHWAEWIVRRLLSARDRETVSGDLLEQYRESELPARGSYRAAWWYVRQGLSLTDGFALGIALGTAFGIYDLYDTWRDPLSDDSLSALFVFYAPMFATWAYAGFRAGRRNYMTDSLKAGAILALVTFTVFDALNFIRVNIFFGSLMARADWQDLMRRAHLSGLGSLRTFVNLDYLKGAPFKIGVASCIGALFGAAGGAVARITKILRPVR